MFRDRRCDAGFCFGTHYLYLLTEPLERFGAFSPLPGEFSNVFGIGFGRHPYGYLFPAFCRTVLALTLHPGNDRSVHHNLLRSRTTPI